MKIVVFGLTISSSWGNEHATVWRGLCRALARRGHRVVFFERDMPYYAAHRDLPSLPYADLELYSDWESALPSAHHHLACADVGIVTSYCPDALTATQLVQSAQLPVSMFYDLDTPVTLERLRAGQRVDYIGDDGLAGFNWALSFSGGPALKALRGELGARRVAALYGSVDPVVHCPATPVNAFRGDLSYLGTCAADRQQSVEEFLIEPARRLPSNRFVIGGAHYSDSFPRLDNLFAVRHLPPSDHASFYCSSRLTLNVTKSAMAHLGYCPSGRLFEAAACGVPIVSDVWDGLEQFFEPGREILLARSADDVIDALNRPPEELQAVGRAGRRRALSHHTADRRAEQLEELLYEYLGFTNASAPAGLVVDEDHAVHSTPAF